MRQLTQAAISFLPSLSGTLSSLLPPLWDGLTPHQPHQAIGHLYSPTDFSIFSSTPNAPPLPAHIPILASRSPYFRSLLLSGLSESRTCSAHFSEPYIIIYTVLYFIYTDTLPSFLLQRGWDTQGDIIAATPWANKIDTIAAGALLAAGAFILPGLSAQLRSVLRRTDSGSRIAPWVFRAAYLTSSESRQRVQSRKQAADSRLMESDPGERWLEEMIRTAETSSSEAEEDPTPFLGEVVEWCYQERSAVERRFKEVMQCQEELDGESGEVEIEEFVWAEFQRLMDDKEASMRSQVHV
ncbi:hypothetical protein BOTBODRAFT_54993 [Botryobasidium botryosum FD-172 SS1]|uniref:BTB domain-containing protein n=1 Tax=Botryobasidium botryosum (strain FD-172 SS1) TaxID=930990 RepID=A0A067MTD8_BOTB1|nr:hypothetical protein BOTBODRAFT_54993 [Botryobasidium botryosum FD-172 SS1]